MKVKREKSVWREIFKIDIGFNSDIIKIGNQITLHPCFTVARCESYLKQIYECPVLFFIFFVIIIIIIITCPNSIF